MIVRCFWRDCEFRHKQWRAEPVDSFWIEATKFEAETQIFPLLQLVAISESRKLADEFKALVEIMGHPDRPFCFLVARDLSSIDPFSVHYPVHQLWGAYSPFETMPEIEITTLKELRSLQLPLGKKP